MAKAPKQTVKVKTPIHLRLTYEDWKETFKGLTRAELGVLYAIRTLDPFGDRELEIDCSTWAFDLGLHRTSVSRALESLSQKQLIDMEIVKAKVKQKVSNRKMTLLTNPKNQSKNEQEEEKESCAPTHTAERPRTQPSAHAQEIASTHTAERPCTTDIYKERARAQTIQKLQTPQTGAGGVVIFSGNSESDNSNQQSASLASKPEESTRQVKSSSEDKNSAAACNDLSQVLDFLGITEKVNSLLSEMERLQVKPCQGYSAERIAGVIKECHLSQLQGALKHVDETWETINNPTAIFCSKAPKMPIEVECRLPEFDRAAYDAQMAQATTPEASKAEIEKIKRERIKNIASSSGDKRLRKFADLIPSMPNVNDKPNTDFETDYAEQQRRLARQMMMEDSGDAAE